MQKINRDRILLVPTQSRYDQIIKLYESHDAARKVFLPSGKAYAAIVRELGSRDASEMFRLAEKKWDNIYEGNIAQKKNVEKIMGAFDSSQIIDRSELTDEVIDKYDLIVPLGGDNHFTYCGQCVLQYLKKHAEKKKYVSGVVLDPERSSGNLEQFRNTDIFLNSLGMLEGGDYSVEGWTTLESRVINHDGVLRPYLTVSELAIGEYAGFLMARNDLFDADLKEIRLIKSNGEMPFPEKTSGVLIVTGAGSSKGSWYYNIAYENVPGVFGRDEDVAVVLGRENRKHPVVPLLKGERLVVRSYNDTRGIVIPDSHEEHSVPFNMGSIAEVWISELKLPVLKL